MACALVLNDMSWMALLVDQKQINTFGVYAAVGDLIICAEDFPQRHLCHDLPGRIIAQDDMIEFSEYARLAAVEQWLALELCVHDNSQLVSSVHDPGGHQAGGEL